VVYTRLIDLAQNRAQCRPLIREISFVRSKVLGSKYGGPQAGNDVAIDRLSSLNTTSLLENESA
jgi:hypothetical protein